MSIITPPPYGRPDYSSPLSNLYGHPFQNSTGGTIASGGKVTYGPFDTTQYGYVAGAVSSPTYPIYVILDWYADIGGITHFEDDVAWLVTPNDIPETDFALPNKGPYVTVTLENHTANVANAISVYLYGTNAPVAVGVNPLAGGTASGASGTTASTPVPFLGQGGFSTFTYFVDAGVGTATLNYTTGSGTASGVFWQDSGFASGAYKSVNLIVPVATFLAEVTSTVSPSTRSWSVSTNTAW